MIRIKIFTLASVTEERDVDIAHDAAQLNDFISIVCFLADNAAIK